MQSQQEGMLRNAMEYDLSVIIPSRNEMFLKNTIEDILKNKRANTEVIAVLDGAWADPSIEQHPDVNIIYVPEAIGQRAATNLGVRLSKARYIMKLDAHCSWEEGCDLKMIEGFREVGDDVTMVPIMRNLWSFDWKCYKCGWKKYQGPTPERCEQCGSTKVRRKMMWVGKHNPQSWSYCFDSEPHFQYFEDYKHRPGIRDAAKSTGFSETMSLQGSCFMSTREKYWELNLCDESLGSWGNQGLEVACRTWLSGGRVLVNHRTWYAHMFRTQGGDFSFPYQQSGRAVSRTKKATWGTFLGGKWDKQVHPISWLVEKFWPVRGWDEAALKRLKEIEAKPNPDIMLKFNAIPEQVIPAPSHRMSDGEFQLLLHQRLCELADTFLYHYNPCQMKDGKCAVGDVAACCGSTRFKSVTGECKFQSETNCTFPNIGCKVWLCTRNPAGVEESCLESLRLIGRLAAINGLGK